MWQVGPVLRYLMAHRKDKDLKPSVVLNRELQKQWADCTSWTGEAKTAHIKGSLKEVSCLKEPLGIDDGKTRDAASISIVGLDVCVFYSDSLNTQESCLPVLAFENAN